MIALQVAAASDLQPVAERLAAEFEKSNPGSRPAFVHAASGLLASQIEAGAPFDIFLSADALLVDSLAASKRVDGKSRFAYARGSLSAWVAKAQPEAAAAKPAATFPLAILKEARYKRIAIANPEHAPYGRLAMDAIARAGIEAAVKKKLVLGTNGAHAVRLAASGEVDAALIPTSFTKAEAKELAAHGKTFPLEKNAAAPLVQEGAIVSATKRRPDAERFARFLRSDVAKAVLRDAGYDVDQHQ